MKFYGQVGFIYEREYAPGAWDQVAEEHSAYGDILSNVRRWSPDTDVNTDLTTSNRISILADRFLCEHMGAMRYVRWNGTVWEIKSVELSRPRAILSLGGVYKGKVYESGEQEDAEEA